MKFGPAFTTMISQNLDAGIVPALMGEPGIGKTSFLKDLATQRGTRCFVVQCNLLADKADLTGGRLVQYTKTDGTSDYRQTFYPHEVISAAIEYALDHPDEDPVLILDEINRTSSDVTSGALGISTERRIGNSALPENLRLVVAGNLNGDVVNLDSASLTRFAIYRIEPDAETFRALHPELNRHIVKVLTDHPECIFSKGTPNAVATGDSDDSEIASFADVFEAGEEMAQITTPRTIINLSKWLNAVEQGDPTLFSQQLAAEVIIDGRSTTELNESVEVYIGNTELTTRVVGEIAEDIQKAATSTVATATISVEPNCYAALKAATSITDLETTILGLDQGERALGLIHAISEQTDNARLIEQLATHVDELDSEHLQRLIQLMTTKQYFKSNAMALVNTTTPISAVVDPILTAFM